VAALYFARADHPGYYPRGPELLPHFGWSVARILPVEEAFFWIASVGAAMAALIALKLTPDFEPEISLDDLPPDPGYHPLPSVHHDRGPYRRT